MADLTLPGDIPGLLRRGSPVSCPNDIGLPFDGWSAVGFSGDVAIIAHPDVLEAHQAMREALILDITNATGRAHASMWLGAHAGLLHGASSDVRPVPGGNILIVEGGPRSRIWHSRDVPAIAHLDPDDLRTIADGSRWVDAEALRLVCLHVAGREVTHG